MSAPDNPIADPQPQPAEALPPAETLTVPATRGENPPWTILDVLLLAAASITVVAIVLFLGIGIGKHFRPSSDTATLLKTPEVVIPTQIVGYLGVLGLMIALLRFRGLGFWTNIRWRWPSGWLLHFFAGIALAVAVQFLQRVLPIPKQLPIEEYFRDATGAYLMAAFGLTMAPLIEELFFRGFCYPALSRRFGIAGAVVITSVVFASLHAGQLANAWAPLLLLFFVSVALTVARIRLQSVAASFLIHVGYNFTLFVAMWLVTDHFRHLENMK